jgi:glutathione synthase/RimK-type ligase-like ATP-grasp enzyme
MTTTISSRDGGNGLIITSEVSGPVEIVLDRLARRGAEVPVVDPTDPQSYEISFPTDGPPVLRLADRQEISLDEMTRIWLWRTALPRQGRFGDRHADIREYQAQAYSAGWRSVLTAPAHWMNDAGASKILEQNKIGQTKLAAQAGLDVIRTLLTDRPADFKAFVRSIDSDVAVKSPVSWHQSFSDLTDSYGTYTRRLTSSQALAMASQVAHAPLLVQPYIEKKYELRITVVARQIFACRIDSQASARTEVDWRHYDFPAVAHEIETLPGDVEKSIHRFMELSGLCFAAIDMIVEPTGIHRFVEANPSGHFGWIESLTGLPISSAIARWLVPAGGR